jgi:hypothetical protein
MEFLISMPSAFFLCLSFSQGHFATKQLWVTPHSDDQIFPAGDYVFGAKDCTGLKVRRRQGYTQPSARNSLCHASSSSRPRWPSQPLP